MCLDFALKWETNTKKMWELFSQMISVIFFQEKKGFLMIFRSFFQKFLWIGKKYDKITFSNLQNILQKKFWTQKWFVKHTIKLLDKKLFPFLALFLLWGTLKNHLESKLFLNYRQMKLYPLKQGLFLGGYVFLDVVFNLNKFK